MYVSGLKKGAGITYGHPGLVSVLRDEVWGGPQCGGSRKNQQETVRDLRRHCKESCLINLKNPIKEGRLSPKDTPPPCFV